MKATSYWFPRNERGLSTAVFDSDQRLANVIGTPLVALAVVAFGWGGAFWTTGILSVVYALKFWIAYRNPKEAKSAGRLSGAEYEHIRTGDAQDEDAVPANPLGSLGYVLPPFRSSGQHSISGRASHPWTGSSPRGRPRPCQPGGAAIYIRFGWACELMMAPSESTARLSTLNLMA
jgi:MFS family permease